MTELVHQPVMLKPVIEGLALTAGDWAIDATFGGGGHTRALLEIVGPTGGVIAFDRDSETLTEYGQPLAQEYPNLRLVKRSFAELETGLAEVAPEQIGAIAGILYDLGYSSLQLDDPERGFSFQSGQILDLRFDRSSGLTAAEWLASYSEKQLAEAFYSFGELYDSRRIAKQIVEYRRKQAILTPADLSAATGLKQPGVLAKLYQAMRIAINQEFQAIEQSLPQAVSLLKPNGRLAILSFHSLEDRLIKRFIQANHRLEAVYRKPIVPTALEIEQNRRARSAKLRLATKIK